MGVSLGSLEQGTQPEDSGNIYEDGDSNQASPEADVKRIYYHTYTQQSGREVDLALCRGMEADAS